MSEPVDVDDLLRKPSIARMYDYFLGGKDNYAIDRDTAEAALEAYPGAKAFARANRTFLSNAVHYLAGEAGIRQFLDIGAGIPTSPNTFEAAQGVAPECRVVYVDNDPIALAHGRAFINSDPRGRTAWIQEDLRNPDAILADHTLSGPDAVLDLSRPVALMLIAIMHFITDEEGPYDLVRTLIDALPSGSYLMLSHVTPDYNPVQIARAVAAYEKSGVRAQVRTRAQVERFLEGLEPVGPGIDLVSRWNAAGASTVHSSLTDEEVSCYGVVARKP
ncbi:SAM-dependent methyltransferase [Streptomyces sp. RB6PN25]|uniref:SAM-dependent methyltransferase n=1 Tax=Streptomyces humicola TaxID=2953240 RepID=A0ABT1PPB6_9ACTN|nr:SAM-dependent methyltransferase [Streptomyces humicola]MCQ4079519.1 SAM-dependent methyltransferase [Streptomyces humicola]